MKLADQWQAISAAMHHPRWRFIAAEKEKQAKGKRDTGLSVSPGAILLPLFAQVDLNPQGAGLA